MAGICVYTDRDGCHGRLNHFHLRPYADGDRRIFRSGHHYQIPVYVSPLEQAWLSNPILNLSGLGRHDDIANIIVQPAEHEFKLTDYEIGGMKFSVVPTPGHSIGSVSFVFDDFVVVGDALFKGSIGRTDLHTGDMQQLLHSITTYLFTLPEEFPVYPGHGDATTIQHEKATNPFFN